MVQYLFGFFHSDTGKVLIYNKNLDLLSKQKLLNYKIILV